MRNIVLIAFLLLPVSVLAQNKVKLLQGSLKPLKEIKSFNIRFVYDSMIIGKDVPEETYLARKKKDWEEKEQGKGEEFYNMWFDYRKLYAPWFKQSFSLFSTVKLDDADAKYTIVVRTRRTEGGWNLGIVNQAGQVEGEFIVVETADNHKVVAKIRFLASAGPSTGGDFEMFSRIQNAYQVAGKVLGEYWKEKAG
ncbi:MAG TPA: hypothetical protein VIU12_03315 [Chryseolinea sp.]